MCGWWIVGECDDVSVEVALQFVRFGKPRVDDFTVASTGIERDEEIPGAKGEGGGQGEGEEKENAREKREEKWEGRTQGTVIGSGDCSNISPSLYLPAQAQQVLVAEEAVMR